MQTAKLSYDEAQVQYILGITKASRTELLSALKLSQVNIVEIINYLKKSSLAKRIV